MLAGHSRRNSDSSDSEPSRIQPGGSAYLTSSGVYKPSSATTLSRPSARDDRDQEPPDDAGDGVWGYLVPIDHFDANYGTSLTLRDRSRGQDLSHTGGEKISKSENTQASAATHTTSDIRDVFGHTIQGGYIIGRHPECDIQVIDPTISNRHCFIFTETRNGEIVAVILDLSVNGTFVNDAIVGRNKRRELKDGDEITVLQKARFIFRYSKTHKIGSFSSRYSILEKLGKGHFAEVFSCVEKYTGEKYAVKIFTKIPGSSRLKLEGLQGEIGVLMGVNHPSVLGLKDTFDEMDAVYMVLELAPEGELFNWIVMKEKLTEAEARKVFIQLFNGVKYLHERGIVHRDIKPENVLLMDKELSVKLCDFGLSKVIGDESFTTTLCGTPSYVAPEILEAGGRRMYTRAVDIWSLGVVLYICLCGFPPFSDELYTKENPYTLSQQIKMGKFDYPSPYWDSVGDPALDLIDRMLTVDVTMRATIADCLSHPWTTNSVADPDNTDALSNAIKDLDFDKRKLPRERTLLSSINDIQIKNTSTSERTPPSSINDTRDKNKASSVVGLPIKIYSKDSFVLERKRTLPTGDDSLQPPAKLSRASANLGTKQRGFKREATALLEIERYLKNASSTGESDVMDTKEHLLTRNMESSDEASRSTDATDISRPDNDLSFSDDDDDLSMEEYNLDGRQAEERILQPEKYFTKLQELEEAVKKKSVVLAQLRTSIERRSKSKFGSSDPQENVMSMDWQANETDDFLDSRATSFHKVQERVMERMFYKSEETLAACYSNIQQLQNMGFCGSFFTIITQERNRSNVARLTKVPIKDVYELLQRLEIHYSQLTDRLYLASLTMECRRMLSVMGLILVPELEIGDENSTILTTVVTLQVTVQALDVAVISYAGTHIRKFCESDLLSQLDASANSLMLELPVNDNYVLNPEIHYYLVQRQLLCMDSFLGHRMVWVFQTSFSTSNNERLWLTTGIEELNDLWGPCWNLYHDDSPGEMKSIEIGNGSLLPWSAGSYELPESYQMPFPQLLGNEIYCHWVSAEEWNYEDIRAGQEGIERKFLNDHDIFLIGASFHHGLAVNSSCKPSKSDLVWKKTRLEEKNALHTPRTSYSRRYKDSHTYQIAASVPLGGVAHAQALSYKRQEGLDRKSALVERWRNNSGNPGELEDFSGVKVSICTQNACRMRLLNILGSDTMRNYLRGLSFAWPSKKFEVDYFDALKSRRKFRKFWNHHLSLSAKISTAVSMCLDILQSTGVNSDNGELGALWVAEFEDEKYQDYSDDDDSDDDMSAATSASVMGGDVRLPFKKVEEVIVTLFRSEYTWTGFLRDSPEIITMAIITSECLEAIDEREVGRRCRRGWWEDGKYVQHIGYPVFETSLFVNESILESAQLVSESVPGRGRKAAPYRVWNTSRLRETSRFSLGDHGTLEVSVVPSKCCPITIMNWKDVKSSTWNELMDVGMNEQFLGRSKEPHHKEHISGVWETKPLPVLIMSQERKEMIL